MGLKTSMNITGERGSPWKVPVLCVAYNLMFLDFYAASQVIVLLVTCLYPEDYLHARC